VVSSDQRRNVVLQPAIDKDIPFLSALAADSDVAPFLMAGAADPDGLRALLSEAVPDGLRHGLFVMRLPQGDRVGGLALRVVNRRSRICELSRLMVSSDHRRTGIAIAAVSSACQMALADHGLHRIQAEVYGDNPGAQALFERAGFVREGTRRSAYWRRGSWQDGVLFGMLADELAARRDSIPGCSGNR
jgi:RimJ/RimL family protein N-acetyltransferase